MADPPPPIDGEMFKAQVGVNCAGHIGHGTIYNRLQLTQTMHSWWNRWNDARSTISRRGRAMLARKQNRLHVPAYELTVQDIPDEPASLFEDVVDLMKHGEACTVFDSSEQKMNVIQKMVELLNVGVMYDHTPTNRVLKILGVVRTHDERYRDLPANGYEIFDTAIKPAHMRALDARIGHLIALMHRLAHPPDDDNALLLSRLLVDCRTSMIVKESVEDTIEECCNILHGSDQEIDVDVFRHHAKIALSAQNTLVRFCCFVDKLATSCLNRAHIMVAENANPTRAETIVEAIMNMHTVPEIRAVLAVPGGRAQLTREYLASILEDMVDRVNALYGPFGVSREDDPAKKGKKVAQQKMSVNLSNEVLDLCASYGLRRQGEQVMAPVRQVAVVSGNRMQYLNEVRVPVIIRDEIEDPDTQAMMEPVNSSVEFAGYIGEARPNLGPGVSVPVCTIAKLVSSVAGDRDDNVELAVSAAVKTVSVSLANIVDGRLPDERSDRYLREFRDGYIDCSMKVGSDGVPSFESPTPVSFKRFGFPIPSGPARGSTRKPIKTYDAGLNGAWAITSPDENACPTFALLWATQIKSLFVRIYGYASFGRLLYPTGTHDKADIIPVIVGIAQSGKSTVGRVAHNFFPNNEVAVLSSNIEPVFGLQIALDKMLAICYEMTRNFRLTRAELQTAASAEDMTVARKHMTPVTKKWRTPMLFIGNELGPWVDVSGSIRRRLFPFHYGTRVNDTNHNMDADLAQEMACIIMLCTVSYQYVIHQHSQGSWWSKNILPQYFHIYSRELSHQSSSMFRVLDSKHFKCMDKRSGYSTSIPDIIAAVERVVGEDENSTITIKPADLTPSNVKAAVQSMEFTIVEEQGSPPHVLGLVTREDYEDRVWKAALAYLGQPSNLAELIDRSQHIPRWEDVEPQERDFTTMTAAKYVMDRATGALEVFCDKNLPEMADEIAGGVSYVEALQAVDQSAFDLLDDDGVPLILSAFLVPARAIPDYDTTFENLSPEEILLKCRVQPRQTVNTYWDRSSRIQPTPALNSKFMQEAYMKCGRVDYTVDFLKSARLGYTMDADGPPIMSKHDFKLWEKARPNTTVNRKLSKHYRKAHKQWCRRAPDGNDQNYVTS